MVKPPGNLFTICSFSLDIIYCRLNFWLLQKHYYLVTSSSLNTNKLTLLSNHYMKSLITFDLDLNKLSVFLIINSNRKLIAGQVKRNICFKFSNWSTWNWVNNTYSYPKTGIQPIIAEILKFNEKSFTKSWSSPCMLYILSLFARSS